MNEQLRQAAQDVVKTWRMYGTAKSLRGWMEILEAALAAEQAQPRPVAWMAMRWGVPAQATTDEPTAIRWRKAGGDVRPLIYADAPPPAPVAQPAAQPRSTGFAAKRDHYAMPVLFNPYTGAPRDVRDVQSDPQGILIQPPGAQLVAAPPAVQPAAQQTQGEPFAWRFTGPGGLKPYLTQSQYDAQTAATKRWYEPYRCASCRDAQQTAVPLTDSQIVAIYEVPELAGSDFPNPTHKAIAIARAIERAHGIGKESSDGAC